jgi:hypothetical protein
VDPRSFKHAEQGLAVRNIHKATRNILIVMRDIIKAKRDTVVVNMSKEIVTFIEQKILVVAGDMVVVERMKTEIVILYNTKYDDTYTRTNTGSSKKHSGSETFEKAYRDTNKRTALVARDTLVAQVEISTKVIVKLDTQKNLIQSK